MNREPFLQDVWFSVYLINLKSKEIHNFFDFYLKFIEIKGKQKFQFQLFKNQIFEIYFISKQFESKQKFNYFQGLRPEGTFGIRSKPPSF